MSLNYLYTNWFFICVKYAIIWLITLNHTALVWKEVSIRQRDCCLQPPVFANIFEIAKSTDMRSGGGGEILRFDAVNRS